MTLTLVVAAFCSLVGVGFAADVCYDDVGCFTTDYPWSDVRRPYPNLPQPPELVGTRFFLYTRNVPDKTLISYNGTDFGDFAASRKTLIIVHGFTDSGGSHWMNSVKDMVLEQWDYNVILVDWAPGAKIPYLQATANTQVVGRQVALLAAALFEKQGAVAADLHLMAHSLGCHICGYAGQRIPGLARITGLDPAQPYFEDTQPEVHLDATDAEFVDVYHTDGRDIIFIGIGFTKACGDVDFFPNNGKNQPGCGDFEENMAGLIWDLETLHFSDIGGLFGCSHDRGHEVFEATLHERSCPFVSFGCRDYAEYESGECQRLDRANIGRLGMDSVRFNLSGSYYLQTTDDTQALCMHYLEVMITLSEDQEDTQGNIIFVIEGSNTTSELLPGWSSGAALSAAVELRTMLHSPVDPSQLGGLRLTYHAQAGPEPAPLRPATVTVRRVDTDLQVTTHQLCGDLAPVGDKETTVFRPCGPQEH